MKRFTKIFIIVTIVLLILLVVFVICYHYLTSDETVEYKTDYGDSFRISYDGFLVKTLISDNNSHFYVIVKDKIESQDIIGLINTTDLKAYMVKDIIFFDEGNGFEFFDSDTNNEKVIDLAKNNLTSEQFYKIINEN